MDKAPEKLWMTAEEMGWPGSFRSFRMSDLEHPEDEYPAYVRADLYEQVKRERDALLDGSELHRDAVCKLVKGDEWVTCGESVVAEYLARDYRWDYQATAESRSLSLALWRHWHDQQKARAEAAERLAGARVKVKLLEWSSHPTGGEQALAAGLGLYRVHANGDDWYLGPDHMGKGGKAAAQSDYESRILSALAEPAGEAEPRQFLPTEDGEFNGNVEPVDDRIPIAATEARQVDWVDVTGWAVFKGHAIPVDVARYIAEKINLYAEHRATPPGASAIREALEALPRRQEKISGQTFSYIKLEDAIAVVGDGGKDA